MTTDEMRRRTIQLRPGESVPVDDIVITNVGRTRSIFTLEAPREVPIGAIRRPEGEQPS